MQRPTEPPESTFARRMREEREHKGISQAHVSMQLALFSGVKVDSTAITRIEKGTRRISLDEAVGIAEALDVSLDYLLEPAPTSDLDEQIEVARKEQEQVELHLHDAQARAARGHDRLRALEAERERAEAVDQPKKAAKKHG